ncbi:MAG: S8 family serine peptidase, partial [Holophagales bacterium]|nr:S8 family serine peptidase [Holophagales bacterium]
MALASHVSSRLFVALVAIALLPFMGGARRPQNPRNPAKNLETGHLQTTPATIQSAQSIQSTQSVQRRAGQNKTAGRVASSLLTGPTLPTTLFGVTPKQEIPPFAHDRVLVKLASGPNAPSAANVPNAPNVPNLRFMTADSGIAYLRSLSLGVAYSEMRLLNPVSETASPQYTGAGMFRTNTQNTPDWQNNVFVLQLAQTGAGAVESALKTLQANPAVEIAEPVYFRKLSKSPNDPMYASQWALENISAEGAWDISTGIKGVVVGVIDSGIDGAHPDLSANLWINPNPNQNGYVNDIHGYNFTARVGGAPTDENGHGTHVAGIIGAKGDNGTGVSGVNWDVSLAWLGVSAGGDWISDDAVIEALSYANTHNIMITNNSYGGYRYSEIERQAIANYRGLFVAAAGNNSLSNDNLDTPHYPASYDLPNIIAVASIDQNSYKSDFSNYGWYSVHLAAPGSDILSTFPNGGYVELSGTSMATPYVAGAAALLMSARPGYTVDDLRTALLYSSRQPNGINSWWVAAYGILDANQAMRLNINALAPKIFVHPVAARLEPGDTHTFRAVALGGGAMTYQWQVSVDSGLTWSDITGATDTSYTGIFNLSDHQKLFRMKAANSLGSVTSGPALLMVYPVVSVAVSPNTAKLLHGAQQQFTASVEGGSGNRDVLWSAPGNQITPDGLFTASVMGTYEITATSADDSRKSDSATVTVAPPVSVSISPETATLSTGGGMTFTAFAKEGLGNGAIAWTATGGTISQSGQSCAYEAPEAPSVYTVTATSLEDSAKSASAVITVVSGLSIDISPRNPTMTANTSQTFTATVTGDSGNKGIVWSASAGDISPSGQFTAPASPQIVTITARSVEDDTKAATAIVTVHGAPDVYVGGCYGFLSIEHTSTNILCYWKNGVRYDIADCNYHLLWGGYFCTQATSVTSIFVSGNDVYAVGQIATLFEDGHHEFVGKLWKNGVEQELDNCILPFSVHVSDSGDVYVTGQQPDQSGDIGCGALWKNGRIIQTFGNSSWTNPYSVFVSCDDVYVVGNNYENPFDANGSAFLWKNGESLTLGKDSRARSFFVSGNDVYICGILIPPGYNQGDYQFAALWKTTTELTPAITYILDGGNHSTAYSVFVSGEDVYVAGENGNQNMVWLGAVQDHLSPDFIITEGATAKLWKNGVRHDLGKLVNQTEWSSARAVYVSGNDIFAAGQMYRPDFNYAYSVLWKNSVAQQLSDSFYNTNVAESIFVHSDAPAKSPVSIAIFPKTHIMPTGGEQTFTASVAGSANTAVTWSVPSGHGSITQTGTYTAPATPGIYAITATSVEDNTKSDTATVTVVNAISVSVSPKTATLTVGGAQTFNATVTGGTGNTAVVWSATGGTITQSGLYTAPNAPGTYTVTATSVEDNTKSDTATVIVNAPVVTGSAVILNAPDAMFTGDTVTLQASVTGLDDTAVTWTASAGTIDQQGRYTAPSSAQTATITAASVQEPSVSASVEIRINSPAMANFDGNTSKTPQLLGIANAFGSRSQADLNKYDLNNNGIVDDGDLVMLF